MRILTWHVHGSWTTSFVQGRHDYLVPVLPGRGPDGRGRARTWDWPASVLEVSPQGLRDADIDAVVLQRPRELDLVRDWTGRSAGVDLPAVYVEHDAPRGPAATSVHPLADRADIPLVHVTHFNRLMWDSGRAPTHVVEHGVIDPGPRYTGAEESFAVVVNEPLRRGRVVGTDVLLDLATRLDVEVYGMGMDDLTRAAPALVGRCHDDVPQHRLHDRLGRHRGYLHLYRWTSLGLSLIEAMMLGLPVLGLATTEAPRAVPAAAGLLTNDLDALVDRARHWLRHPQDAADCGAAARAHALARYGLARFLDDWDRQLEGVSA